MTPTAFTREQECIATFTVQRLQFMNAQGKLTQALPESVSISTLQKLYQQMSLTRAVDNKAVKLQRTGQLGTYPASTGQEAVSVGLGAAMQDNDVFCPYYRDQGSFLQRGVRIEDIYQYWGGDERGSLIPQAVNQHDLPVCVPIASQYQHAAGIAFAMRYKQEKNAVVTTGGEGSTSEGDFFEAMNLAGTHQLPLVFVINNNQWAISVPRQQQTGAQTIAQKAIAAGFEGQQVDGNDVAAVYVAVSEALNKARQGGGPTLIEAVTYRLCDHTTADDFSRYKDSSYAQAEQEEPLIRLRQYLTTEGAWSEQQEQDMLSSINEEVQAASERYCQLDKPKKQDMFDHLYANMPADVAAQKNQLLESI